MNLKDELLWADTLACGGNLAAARLAGECAVYRRLPGQGWRCLTAPMRHWEVERWQRFIYTVPEPAPLPGERSGWLSRELAGLYARTRPHPRLSFPYARDGIWLSLDGKIQRRLTHAPQRLRDAPTLVRELTAAAWLGHWHGECDWHGELAATLNGEHVPGHPAYGYDHTGAAEVVVLRIDGTTTPLTLPDVRPKYVRGQLVNALDDVARIAGRLATGPE